MKRFFYFTLTLIILFCGLVPIAEPSAQVGQAIAAETTYADTLGITPLGGTPLTVSEERIDYAYKVEDEYINPYKLPGYLSKYTCGITAGGNVVGFYDRIYDELIPNHTSKIILGKFFYGSQGIEVNSMYDTLYTAMKATSEGVSMDNYLNGISTYVTNKGRTATFTSVLNGTGTLNSTQYKTALQNGKVLSIFLDGFSIIDYSDLCTYSNYDTVRAYLSNGAHIMIAFGYLDISYYNSNNQCFRIDRYLHVSTGYTTPVLSLVKLNQWCVVDDCFISDIN